MIVAGKFAKIELKDQSQAFAGLAEAQKKMMNMPLILQCFTLWTVLGYVPVSASLLATNSGPVFTAKCITHVQSLDHNLSYQNLKNKVELKSDIAIFKLRITGYEKLKISSSFECKKMLPQLDVHLSGKDDFKEFNFFRDKKMFMEECRWKILRRLKSVIFFF